MSLEVLGPAHGEGVPTIEQVRVGAEKIFEVYSSAGASGFQILSIGNSCTPAATPVDDLDYAVSRLGEHAHNNQLREAAKMAAQEATGRLVDLLTFEGPFLYLNNSQAGGWAE